MFNIFFSRNQISDSSYFLIILNYCFMETASFGFLINNIRVWSTYVGFQFGSLDQSQSQTECSLCSIPRACVVVFHSLPLMPPAFSILIEMGNLKSLLGIPLFSGLFPFICRPGSISTTFVKISPKYVSRHPILLSL